MYQPTSSWELQIVLKFSSPSFWIGYFEIGQVKKELNDLGVDYDLKEFYDYLRPFLIKIDELTPLKNGNN